MSNRSQRVPAWRPTATLGVAQCRARMLQAARAFFAENGILEVDTPALSPAAVSDPQIESIAAVLAADPGRAWYLQTSPEYAMKRLLADGWPDMYQIGKVWRDGEIGPRHRPEFTLVEWYRRGLELGDMMRHTVDFISRVLDEHELGGEVDYVRYDDMFRQHAGVDVLAASVDELAGAAEADDGLRKALGEDREGWLDLLLTRRVAPKFAADRLTVLHHYPAAQAALARHCPGDERFADRFEVFFGRTELANGYRELTDAAEQRRRFERDQQQRMQRRKALRPLDRQLLAAMAHGLPDCCGVAVGFDRLVLVNVDCDDLEYVQTFPVPEPAHDTGKQ